MFQTPQNLTEIVEKPLVVLLCNNKEQGVIENVLKHGFKVKCYTNFDGVLHTHRSYQIKAIVSYISKVDTAIFEMKTIVCEQFPSISKIAIINDTDDIELIRKCGEIGVDKVILSSEKDELESIINELSNRKGIKVTLDDLDIECKDLPELLQKALLLIERNYLKIRFIEDISNQLGISYSLLACMFKKSPLLNSKRILLFFKIRHSLYLLRNNDLSIYEISSICGFSNEKRFREGLRRIFGKSPTECKCELLSTTVDEYWNNCTTV
jgi:AraC-like DNA-binding protein